jgi:hypothetical protein
MKNSTINRTPKHAHVGVGLCEVCHHYGADCTGSKLKGKAKQLAAEQLLARMVIAQNLLWDLSNELEALVGFDIDTTNELSAYTLADLKRIAVR